MNIKTLIENGWKEYPDPFRKYARCFYKRIQTPTRCSGNDDKDGIQVCLSVSEYGGRESIELEICAGLKDETWIKLLSYSLPGGVDAALAAIPRMIATWEFMANFNQETK